MEGSLGIELTSTSTLLHVLTLSLILSIFGSSFDIILITAFKSYEYRDSVQQFIQTHINPAILIHVSKYVTTLFVTLQLTRYILGLVRSESSGREFPVKPLLFPCQTSHVRMFPKKHGFSYSYLMVGIPVGWNGNAGGMISSEEEKDSWYSRWFSLKPGQAWWTVNSDQYLGRGHAEDGLAGKLREYLQSQNVDPQRYAHAYLLTAGKFLNYAFNPISIWHLYSTEKELKALVLEVNNTSDERRMYFLEPSSTKLLSKDPNLPDSVRYTGTWNKDFYVSTFNDRAGKYSIAAYDPIFPCMTRTGPVNTTITLNSPDSRAMLVARLYSAGPALDPSTISVWAKTKFLASWWWVGFFTFFPRTVHEAFRLFVRRGMPWVSRPEPTKDTMSRHADLREICIERQFREYLRDTVQKSDLSVRYIPAGLVGVPTQELLSRNPSPEDNSLEFRVLTPVFYSRIVQYTDIYSGLLLEIQSQTITISNPDLLKHLNFDTPFVQKSKKISWTRIYFNIIARIRSQVSSIPLLETPDPEIRQVQVPAQSHQGLSALDIFVSAAASPAEEYAYASGVLKLLCAERFVHGWMEILDFEIFVLRVVIAWVVVKFVLV